jgi:hypothetical protein
VNNLFPETGLTRAGIIELRRALGSNEIASILEDPTVRAGTANLVNYRNPLRMNIPRKTPASAGQSAAIITRHTVGATPAEFKADTSEPTEDTGTPAQVSFTYRTIIGRMKVTRLAQLIGRSYVDVFSQEAGFKAEGFKNFEEKYMIAGDNAVSNVEWDGVNKLVPSAQVFKMTSLQGGNVAVTEKLLRETIDACKGASPVYTDTEGRPSAALLTSEGGGRELDALISSRQRLNDTEVIVNGGFRMTAYDRLPIFRTNTFGSAIYNDGVKPTQPLLLGTTGGSTVLYCLNFEELWFEELEAFNVVPLARASSQYDQADLREVGALVLRNTESISMLIGIQVS